MNIKYRLLYYLELNVNINHDQKHNVPKFIIFLLLLQKL